MYDEGKDISSACRSSMTESDFLDILNKYIEYCNFTLQFTMGGQKIFYNFLVCKNFPLF